MSDDRSGNTWTISPAFIVLTLLGVVISVTTLSLRFPYAVLPLCGIVLAIGLPDGIIVGFSAGRGGSFTSARVARWAIGGVAFAGSLTCLVAALVMQAHPIAP